MDKEYKDTSKCPVPGCELIPAHVPYVTDFCHTCGGDIFTQKMSGLLCNDCRVLVDRFYVHKDSEHK